MNEIRLVVEAIFEKAQSLENARNNALKSRDFDKLNKACLDYYENIKEVMNNIRMVSGLNFN